MSEEQEKWSVDVAIKLRGETGDEILEAVTEANNAIFAACRRANVERPGDMGTGFGNRDAQWYGLTKEQATSLKEALIVVTEAMMLSVDYVESGPEPGSGSSWMGGMR